VDDEAEDHTASIKKYIYIARRNLCHSLNISYLNRYVQ